MNESDRYAESRNRLLAELRAEQIRDPRVLEVMERVPRERFVPDAIRRRAYENKALPIGEGQTISQPFIVALMSEALALRRTDEVLEIGTGSGYQTAILAELAGRVHSVERSAALATRARALLEQLGYQNVELRVGDGSRGLPEEAPFDAICVTAASPGLPAPLEEQLAVGGRLVIPLGQRHRQMLCLFRRGASGVESERLCAVAFVPLVGEHAWQAAGGRYPSST